MNDMNFSNARRVIRHTFEDDKDLRIAYQANVAMLLHDKYGITDFKLRNQAAIDILELIFDTKFNMGDI